MIIFNLITILMLTTSKKPYNPNYDPLATDDINWNKSDLSLFLDNIHNVPINDITITGKEISFYQTATKAEIAAELISTINLIHYKLLSAVKDLINYNNVLINKTQKTNKTIDFCVKKIEDLSAQTQRNNFLLFKMAHNKPELQLGDFKNNIDTNIEEPIPTIIIGPTEQTIEQTKQINYALANSCPNMRTQNILLNEPSNDNTINTITPPSTADIIDDGHIATFNKAQSKIPFDEPIQSIIIHSTEQNIEPTQSITIDANTRNQNSIINEPQLKDNIINTITIPSTTDIIDDGHINTFNNVQSKNTLVQPSASISNANKLVNKKTKPKIKMKKKKIKNKYNNKRNNKKKRKQQKNPKTKITAKNIISNFELEQLPNDCTQMTIPYTPNPNKQKRNKGINIIRKDIDIKMRYGIYRTSKCLEKQLQDILPYEEYKKNEQQAYYELNEKINYAVFNR